MRRIETTSKTPFPSNVQCEVRFCGLVGLLSKKLGSSEGKQGNVLFIYSIFDVNLELRTVFEEFNDFFRPSSGPLEK